MARVNLPSRQMVALAVTGLMLALMIWGNLGWLGSWFSGLLLTPAEARYNYNDFGAEAAAMKLVGTPNLFDPAAQLALQQELWGDRLPQELKQPFVRVPWAVFLLWPLAQLPHAAGFLVLTVLSILAAVWALLIWGRWAKLPQPVALAFLFGALGCLPMIRTLTLGQHSAFLLLALTGAVIWSMQGKGGAAGAALVGATLKPHLIMLVPLAWLLQRRWMALFVGAAGLIALALLSLLLLGMDNILGFFTIQGTFERYFPDAEAIVQMQNWRGLLFSTLGFSGSGAEIANLLLMGLSAVAVLWAWWPFGRKTLLAQDLRWGLTIIASLLFSYHLHYNDLLVWVVPVAIALRRVYAPPLGGELSEREKQITFALIWVAWIVPWIAFFAPTARPALWVALIAAGLMIMRINKEQAQEPVAA